MRFITMLAVLALLLAGIMAKPLCVDNSEDSGCKHQRTFNEVDCVEKLKFKHPKATCFMNDKDEFIIMAVNDIKFSKRSPSLDIETYAKSYGPGSVVMQRRPLRSVADEEDLRAEVLSRRELKDMMNNRGNEINTENPLNTNEVSPTINTHNTDENSEAAPVMGIIFVFTAVEGADNDVTADSQETFPSASNGEEDMAEALFGLLLLGAIMEEVKKHQISDATEQD